jgi:hypothetical protein
MSRILCSIKFPCLRKINKKRSAILKSDVALVRMPDIKMHGPATLLMAVFGALEIALSFTPFT